MREIRFCFSRCRYREIDDTEQRSDRRRRRIVGNIRFRGQSTRRSFAQRNGPTDVQRVRRSDQVETTRRDRSVYHRNVFKLAGSTGSRAASRPAVNPITTWRFFFFPPSVVVP